MIVYICFQRDKSTTKKNQGIKNWRRKKFKKKNWSEKLLRSKVHAWATNRMKNRYKKENDQLMRAGSTYHWYSLFHWTWQIAFSAPDDSRCSMSTWRDEILTSFLCYSFVCLVNKCASNSVCSWMFAILHNVHAFLCYFQCHQIVHL